MSLVQSIFGDIPSKNDGGGTSTLFDASLVEQTSSSQKEKSKLFKQEKTDRGDDDDDDDDDDNSSPGSNNSNDSSSDNNDNKKGDTPKGSSAKKPLPSKSTPPPPQDEEERTIFVGNLPLSATRRTLTKLFSECGKIQSTRLRSVAVAGVKVPQDRAGDQNLVKKVCTNTKQLDVDAKSSLQGYVVFVNKESADKALQQFNNHPLQDDHPSATRAIRRIRVDRASPTLDPKRSVFVGNLPYAADEATLQDCFVQGCGFNVQDVVGIRIIRDSQTYQCKGFGYVLFQDSTMVATALQKMDQVEYMKRPLRVKVCGKSIKGRRVGDPKTKKRSWNDTTIHNSGTENNPRNNKKLRTITSSSVSAGSGAPAAVLADGAMKRVARKEKKNKRKRGEKKKYIPGSSNTGSTPGAGKSKRAASEAKTEKRVKKLQKRISKGMGKTRK